MDQLPQEVIDLILKKLSQGEYEVVKNEIRITLGTKKEKYIYPRKNGKFQLIIPDYKTKKRHTIGSYDTLDKAVSIRDQYVEAINEEKAKLKDIIDLNKFRNQNETKGDDKTDQDLK